MENDLRSVNAKANAGMATGITALGIEAVSLLGNGGLGNLLGGILGGNQSGGDAAAATAAAMSSIAAMTALAGAGRSGGSCNEDHIVNRYEAAQQARIAELETEVKLRDANTYTDSKMLELYQYIDGRMRGVESQLCQQAVKNQETADAFLLVGKDIQRERDERCCGDNSIITYLNATFYPKQVADVTTGTTTTSQSLYNPLPNCGGCCRN